MFYAHDSEKNRIRPTKGIQATCPCCDNPVVAKMGDIVVHHWAHQPGSDCHGTKPMTEWHKRWQGYFPEVNREVLVFGFDDRNHIADVKLVDGFVLEMQHSPIGTKTIGQREEAYHRMMWVFDTARFKTPPKIAAYNVGFIERFVYSNGAFRNVQGLGWRDGEREITFLARRCEVQWRNPHRTLYSVTKPIVFDTPDGLLFYPDGLKSGSTVGFEIKLDEFIRVMNCANDLARKKKIERIVAENCVGLEECMGFEYATAREQLQEVEGYFEGNWIDEIAEQYELNPVEVQMLEETVGDLICDAEAILNQTTDYSRPNYD